MHDMDDHDRQILQELVRHGRLSYRELGERVGLSAAGSHRRVRALEREGVITGYRTQVDAAAVGYLFEALVFVRLHAADEHDLEAFEKAVAEVPEVLQAQRLLGDPEYLLRVAARSVTGLRELYDACLSRLPGVERLTSTRIVTKTVVVDRPPPV